MSTTDRRGRDGKFLPKQVTAAGLVWELAKHGQPYQAVIGYDLAVRHSRARRAGEKTVSK
jgi:hypothetical protein